MDSNKPFRMGVYLTNSDIRVFQLKDFITSGSLCWRMESASLEHRVLLHSGPLFQSASAHTSLYVGLQDT